MKPTTKEWISYAKDDLDVANEIIEVNHLTNMVSFHAHQSIEKCFKAVMEEYEINAQRIHNLETLYNKVESILKIDVDINILKELNEVYISSRYPSDLGLLPFGKPTKEYADKFINFANDVYEKILIFLEGTKR